VVRLGATPVSLSLLSIQVYAASSEKETSKKELLKIEELSLYSSPARETKYVENPQTQLEEGVSRLRHVMEPYTAWCQDAYAKAMPKLEKAVEHGRGKSVHGFKYFNGVFLSRNKKWLMHSCSFSFYVDSCVVSHRADKTPWLVAGTQLYDWSLQGYIAVESLWKDNPKKKKSGKKSDK
ncbi:MIC26 protein, partial [Corythaeola cristata]|nr:MIC26 protein [Corythaeola cristata]